MYELCVVVYVPIAPDATTRLHEKAAACVRVQYGTAVDAPYTDFIRPLLPLAVYSSYSFPSVGPVPLSSYAEGSQKSVLKSV